MSDELFPGWKSFSLSQRSDWLWEKEKRYLKQIDSENRWLGAVHILYQSNEGQPVCLSVSEWKFWTNPWFGITTRTLAEGPYLLRARRVVYKIVWCETESCEMINWQQLKRLLTQYMNRPLFVGGMHITRRVSIFVALKVPLDKVNQFGVENLFKMCGFISMADDTIHPNFMKY